MEKLSAMIRGPFGMTGNSEVEDLKADIQKKNQEIAICKHLISYMKKDSNEMEEEIAYLRGHGAKADKEKEMLNEIKLLIAKQLQSHFDKVDAKTTITKDTLDNMATSVSNSIEQCFSKLIDRNTKLEGLLKDSQKENTEMKSMIESQNENISKLTSKIVNISEKMQQSESVLTQMINYQKQSEKSLSLIIKTQNQSAVPMTQMIGSQNNTMSRPQNAHTGMSFDGAAQHSQGDKSTLGNYYSKSMKAIAKKKVKASVTSITNGSVTKSKTIKMEHTKSYKLINTKQEVDEGIGENNYDSGLESMDATPSSKCPYPYSGKISISSTDKPAVPSIHPFFNGNSLVTIYRSIWT